MLENISSGKQIVHENIHFSIQFFAPLVGIVCVFDRLEVRADSGGIDPTKIREKRPPLLMSIDARFTA